MALTKYEHLNNAYQSDPKRKFSESPHAGLMEFHMESKRFQNWENYIL